MLVGRSPLEQALLQRLAMLDVQGDVELKVFQRGWIEQQALLDSRYEVREHERDRPLVARADRPESLQPRSQRHVEVELDEGSSRRQQQDLVPLPLAEAHGAEKTPVQGGVRSLETLRPHVLVLKNVPEQAPHLGVRRPRRDRLQIGGEEPDQMVMLRGVAPDLPAREPASGEASQKWVGHGRMGLDLRSELPDKLAGSHGGGAR